MQYHLYGNGTALLPNNLETDEIWHHINGQFSNAGSTYCFKTDGLIKSSK